MELQDPSGARAVVPKADQLRGTSSVDPSNDGDDGDLYNVYGSVTMHAI